MGWRPLAAPVIGNPNPTEFASFSAHARRRARAALANRSAARPCLVDIAALAAAHPDHWQPRRRHPRPDARRRRRRQFRPFRHADGHGRRGHRAVREAPAFDAAAPDWPDRDRFILSAGHGSMLLYSLLHLTGSPDMTLEQMKTFRQLGAITAGHPEYGHAKGIETTTGPLGQGLANAVGFAMAEEFLRARFGRKIVDHRTWVIAGDGCLMEGVSQEAIGAGRPHELSAT
jgi:transketolase